MRLYPAVGKEHLRGTHANGLIADHLGKKPFDTVTTNPGIVIQGHNEGPPCIPDTSIRSTGETKIGRIFNNDQPFKMGFEIFNTAVPGCIVNNDDLQIGIGLGSEASNTIIKKFLPVIIDNNHTDGGADGYIMIHLCNSAPNKRVFI